jgi:hypothetical protein
MRASLAICSASLKPVCSVALVENPHCGLSANCAMSTWRLASSMRRLRKSADSSSACLEATRPSTTILSLGNARSGANVPARALSYSRK